MRAKTKAAYLDWKSEADRLRLANECDPDAFTTCEFAERANISESNALRHLRAMVKAGRVVKCKKRVSGYPATAYKMVKGSVQS